MGGVVVEVRAVPYVPRRHPPVPLSPPWVSLKSALDGSGGRAEGREASEGWEGASGVGRGE